jgi:hypothetical protein
MIYLIIGIIMIRYKDLVEYTKENHISWNEDLFDVLRGFFGQYYQPPTPSNTPIQQELIFSSEEFKEPKDGEYTVQDLISLFSL